MSNCIGSNNYISAGRGNSQVGKCRSTAEGKARRASPNRNIVVLADGHGTAVGENTQVRIAHRTIGRGKRDRARRSNQLSAGEGDISITGSDGKTVHRDIGAKGIKGNTLVGTSDLDDEVGDPLVLTIQPEFSVRRIPPGLAGLGIDGDSAASGIDPESAVGYRNRARGFGCRQGNIIRLKIIAAKING